MTGHNQIISDAIAESVTASTGFPVRSYSGRGMYGRTCLGICLPSTNSLLNIGLIIYQAVLSTDQYSDDESIGLASEICDDGRTDQMGMGFILYFPQLPAPSVEATDEDQ